MSTTAPAGKGAERPSAAGTEDAATRRRHAVLAGHQGDGDGAVALLGDDDPTVRAAALGALGRLGRLDDDMLLGALGDPDPSVRRRACAMAGRGDDTDPDADPVGGAVIDKVIEMLADVDPTVVETAAWALGECGGDAASALDRLSAVAAGHESPLCREAAVAALGAIGVPASLTVVLAALDDTPNIRRRAAIALAAFDDPRAEAGLRRCLEDRDWQVRQAAEVLLADDQTADDQTADD